MEVVTVLMVVEVEEERIRHGNLDQRLLKME
jgi:hypothetical protein